MFSEYLLYAGETLEVETILAILHLDFGARREGGGSSGFRQRRGLGRAETSGLNPGPPGNVFTHAAGPQVSDEGNPWAKTEE